MRRELLESKPAVCEFIKRLKASHPRFMQPAQLTPRHPVPHAALAKALPQQGAHLPLHSSAPGKGRLPRQRPDVAMHQSSFNRTPPNHGTPHGSPWQHQHQAMSWYDSVPNAPSPALLHQQHGTVTSSFTSSNGSRTGAVVNCPGAELGMPAPPPGFALVPIAPDGSLHYQGAITGPQQGSAGFPQGFGRQGPWPHPPSRTQIQQTPAIPQPQPQPADQYFGQPQQQQQWHQLQQPRQKPLLESSQHIRKRKHPDNGFYTNRGEGNVCGNSGGGSGGGGPSGGGGGVNMLPASNANAAAQLRDRLKAATTATTAGCSSLQEPRALPRQPQPGKSNAQQAQHGQSDSEGQELKSSGGAQTADPAELQIPQEGLGSHASLGLDASPLLGDSDQDPYQGPHGPDCIRADDRTQVRRIPVKATHCMSVCLSLQS